MLADRELVVFSPLPPCKSGIGAYTEELLPALGAALRTVVVVQREEQAREVRGALVIGQARYRAAGWLRDLPHVYQLGNNIDHGFVYHAALRKPGLVVLHDVVLHHLVEEMTLGRNNPAGYEAAMVYGHGAAGLRLARLRQDGVFSERQKFLLPLHQEILDRARGIIVHSRFAAGRCHPNPAVGGAEVPVRVVPHHVSPRVLGFDGLTRAAAREKLALPAEGPVLLSLGYVTPPKQVGLALRALARLRDEGVAFRYVIGGQIDTEEDIPGLISELGLEERVRVTGYLSEEAFFTYARAADLLVNLRFPLAGESSGTLARALGMGLPAVAFDFGPASEYPDEVVAKVAFSRDPLPALAATIAGLLADPGALAARGVAAREYAHRCCNVTKSADVYLTAIRDWL